MSVTSIERRRKGVSKEEWDLRVDLAAFYRAYELFGWTDMLATHVSARMPGHPEQFLINPYGLLFREVTASNLIVLDMEGNVVRGDYGVNNAGFAIHSAVLKARPDVNCVAHSHTRAGIGVGCMRCGLLPLSQHAMVFHGRLAYHDWDLPTGNEDECKLMAADLGDKSAMILRNHGLLTVGRTVAEAFNFLYLLEMSCRFQLDAMQAGAELVMPSPASVERTAREFFTAGDLGGELEWAAIRRDLDRRDPSYKT